MIPPSWKEDIDTPLGWWPVVGEARYQKDARVSLVAGDPWKLVACNVAGLRTQRKLNQAAREALYAVQLTLVSMFLVPPLVPVGLVLSGVVFIGAVRKLDRATFEAEYVLAINEYKAANPEAK